MKWYVIAVSALAFVLLGLCIGLLTGLSRSPVVSVLIPLLFGLIGGTGGLYIARLDISDKPQQHNLMIVSVAVGMLAIGTAAGVFLGIDSREVDQSWPQLNNGSAFPPVDAQHHEIVDWILLDSRLQLLGLNQSQRHSILSRVTESMSASGTVSDFDVDLLESSFKSAYPDAALYRENDSVSEYEEWQQALFHTENLLVLLRTLERPFDHQAFVSELNLAIAQTAFLNDRDIDQQHFSSNPKAVEQMRIYKALLSQLSERGNTPLRSANSKLQEFLLNNSSDLGSLRVRRDIASDPLDANKSPG